MRFVADTPRQKLWMLILALGIVPGALGAESTAAGLGMLVGGALIYLAPVLFYHYIVRGAVSKLRAGKTEAEG